MRKLTSWFGAGRKAAPTGPVMPLDLLAPAFIADPAPTYAWLRDTAPLAPIRTGGYLMTRAVDIHNALTDPRLGNAPSRFSMLASKNQATYTAAAVAANIPPFLDKPRHVDMRRPLSAAFFDALDGADAWLGPMATEAANRLAGLGPVDVLAGFGRPFATEAMARFVGVPHDPAMIATATAALFKLFAPIMDRVAFAQVNSGLEATRFEIGRAIARPTPATQGSLIGHLIQRGEMTDEEIADNALLVLADGIENIEAAIGQAVLILARHPEHRAAVQNGADPTALVQEVLRLESPAQSIPRVVREAHDRDGIGLPEGTPVFLALGSANRDPAWHEAPDRFDPARDQSRTLLFGLGRHRCIGAPLAQKLVVSAVRALCSRPVQVVGHDVTYHPRLGHRWPTRVMVSVS